jgi:hypothetical protein
MLFHNSFLRDPLVVTCCIKNNLNFYLSYINYITTQKVKIKKLTNTSLQITESVDTVWNGSVFNQAVFTSTSILQRRKIKLKGIKKISKNWPKKSRKTY